MKRNSLFAIIWIFISIFYLTGCCRSSEDVWDDTKTAGRHMSRGLCSLGGKHGDSRQVRCREDFYQCNDDYCLEDFESSEFESFPDKDFSKEIAMANIETKRAKGKTQVPGIDGFKDTKSSRELSNIFQNIHFPYNSNLIKGTENLGTLKAIATYMKKHPDTYIFVEGHCDERGAEAYNLALGARRCNTVSDLLVKEGVKPSNIFTISYGKERPLVLGNTEDAWAKNRRAEFKIFQR